MATLEDLEKLVQRKILEINTFITQNSGKQKQTLLREISIKLSGFQTEFNNLRDSLELDASKGLFGPSAGREKVQDEIDFGEFLSDIGDSIVETQQKLDGKSKKYLSEIKGQPHIQPSVFRIPKVSAEIKFGMRKSKGRGFNIIIAKRKDEEETSLNQSMQFEILSVPPPPDFQQAFYNQVPALGFVFSPYVRAAIFRDVARYVPRPSGTENEQVGLGKDLLEKDPDNVLVLQVHPNIDKTFEDYLLLYADSSADKNVGIWYLQRDPNPDPKKVKKPILEIVLKFSLSPRKGENYKILRDFVIKYSKLQQKLL